MALPFSFYRPEDANQYLPSGLLAPEAPAYTPPAQGLLPQDTNKPGGLLGFLQRPGIADALISGGSAMVQAAQPVAGMRRPGFGAGIGAGLAGFNQGFDAYGQRIAQGQSDAINQRIKAAELAKLESGGAAEWNTDYSNRVRINADRIQRAAEQQGTKMDRQEAEQLSAQYIDTLASQNARAIAEFRAQLDERMLGLKAQIEPKVAGEVTTAELQAKKGFESTTQQPIDENNARKAVAQLSAARDKVNEAMSKADWTTTGFVGSMMRKLPGSDAFDLSKTLDTVKSNLGLDTLVSLKNAGGTLGAVSEKELELLLSKIASLEQAQSEEQFRAQLGDVLTSYDSAVQNISADLNARYPGKGKPAATPTAKRKFNPATGRVE